MSAFGQKRVLCKIDAALLALKELRVPFRGPFVTPKDQRLYIVGSCIFTEPELIALHEEHKRSIASRLLEFRRLQETASGNAGTAG